MYLIILNKTYKSKKKIFFSQRPDKGKAWERHLYQ